MNSQEAKTLIKQQYGTCDAYYSQLNISTCVARDVYKALDGEDTGVKTSTIKKFLEPLGYTLKITVVRNKKKR